jgi:hypothetical protein
MAPRWRDRTPNLEEPFGGVTSPSDTTHFYLAIQNIRFVQHRIVSRENFMTALEPTAATHSAPIPFGWKSSFVLVAAVLGPGLENLRPRMTPR